MLARNPLTVGTWSETHPGRWADLYSNGILVGSVYRYGGRWDAWADRGTSIRGKRGKLHLGPFVSEDKARAAVEAALSAPVRKPDYRAIAKTDGAWLSGPARRDPNDEHRLTKSELL